MNINNEQNMHIDQKKVLTMLAEKNGIKPIDYDEYRIYANLKAIPDKQVWLGNWFSIVASSLAIYGIGIGSDIVAASSFIISASLILIFAGLDLVYIFIKNIFRGKNEHNFREHFSYKYLYVTKAIIKSLIKPKSLFYLTYLTAIISINMLVCLFLELGGASELFSNNIDYLAESLQYLYELFGLNLSNIAAQKGADSVIYIILALLFTYRIFELITNYLASYSSKWHLLNKKEMLVIGAMIFIYILAQFNLAPKIIDKEIALINYVLRVLACNVIFVYYIILTHDTLLTSRYIEKYQSYLKFIYGQTYYNKIS